ncbi:MAG: NADH-quinone oxidoreductase subunit NuoF [Candidatus Eisenbacteria sp.]|nr:NADH-quinone oxidoreductase subunit NuoF [Candidatus Eisenbacteria bacterium]
MAMKKELQDKIEQIASRYSLRESALMPALDLAQAGAEGTYIPPDLLKDVAETIGVRVNRAYGLQTYYSMYNRKPVGKYHLQVDTNIPAMLMGAGEVLDRLKEKLGIGVGETTTCGRYTLSTVEDLGSCGTCPVIQVNDRYYESMTPEKVDKLLDSLGGDKMPDWKAETYWESDCDILLRRRGKADSTSISSYIADGGYKALEKALKMKPAKVTAEVKAAGIQGRGGAGFPAGVKWGFLPKDSEKPVYLVCNADEGEPGTFKDRQIMEYDPHLLLEGMAICAHAIGAHEGFIYIRGEFSWIADILEKAVNEAKEADKLGPDFRIIVHRGAGAYVCGEETALIESLEGKRGDPRLKPPFPAVEGLYGCPTIVNNVETLANIPYVIEHGAEAYKKFGAPDNHGPKIFGLSGHVNKPGVYEYPLGTPLKTLLEKAGGVKGKLKAVIVGGLSVPILTAEEAADLNLDYDSCTAHGTMLGSGGIMVIAEGTSIPEIALRTIEFYAHESCGQCTPCREGSNAILYLLKRMVDGGGKKADIDAILRLCGTIKGSTLCPTGDAFSLPIEAMVQKFRPEFEALISSP